ncbi:hypothetical protein HDU97_004808 [Phlyctochytrium planicorne]|nr:hypothetical protein HDU97_004808 [Phlyctochytrium planicorne]
MPDEGPPETSAAIVFKDKNNNLMKLLVQWISPKMERIINIYVKLKQPPNPDELANVILILNISYLAPTATHLRTETALSTFCQLVLCRFLQMMPPEFVISSNDAVLGAHFENGWKLPGSLQIPLDRSLSEWGILASGQHIVSEMLDVVDEYLQSKEEAERDPDDVDAWRAVAAIQCFNSVFVKMLGLHKPFSHDYGLMPRLLSVGYTVQYISAPTSSAERNRIAASTSLKEILEFKCVSLRFFQNPFMPTRMENDMLAPLEDWLAEIGRSGVPNLHDLQVTLGLHSNLKSHSNRYNSILKTMQKYKRLADSASDTNTGSVADFSPAASGKRKSVAQNQASSARVPQLDIISTPTQQPTKLNIVEEVAAISDGEPLLDSIDKQNGIVSSPIQELQQLNGVDGRVLTAVEEIQAEKRQFRTDEADDDRNLKRARLAENLSAALHTETVSEEEAREQVERLWSSILTSFGETPKLKAQSSTAKKYWSLVEIYPANSPNTSVFVNEVEGEKNPFSHILTAAEQTRKEQQQLFSFHEMAHNAVLKMRKTVELQNVQK